jgi:hypothetical protein
MKHRQRTHPFIEGMESRSYFDALCDWEAPDTGAGLRRGGDYWGGRR